MDSSKRNGLLVGGVIGMTGFSIFLLGKKLWKIFFKKRKSSDKKSVCFEIGGTNIRVMVNDKPVVSFDSLIKSVEDSKEIKDYKTRDKPEETIQEICSWVKTKFTSDDTDNFNIGVSMFGPINLLKGTEEYGKVLNTPKPGWSGFHLVNSLIKNLQVKKDQIFVELDVNCAAYLEYKFGNHGVKSLAYITIGTGVGVGLMVEGKINKGLEGPEGGHIRVRRHEEDKFEGNCPFHKDCLEGLIANGAIKLRKNLQSVEECKNIDSSDQIWDFIAYYLAQLCLSLLLLPSVEKIVIGGGLANRTSMIQKTREQFFKLNNNYINNPKLSLEGLKTYITRTNFMNNSGILSAFSIIQ